MPSAVSYRMIAPTKPPLAEATITASDVAMKSALPSPQPARKPTMPSIECAAPASALNATISTNPAASVRFAPIRLETQPVISMATAVITKVAREQQLDLARRRLQLLRQCGEDGVDEADAHERHDARERDREDRLRLTEGTD